MGIQDFIALAIALAAAVFVIRFTWRSFSGGPCCGDQGDGSSSGSCSKAPVRSGIQQTPMVAINEVGVIKADAEPPRPPASERLRSEPRP